VKRTRRLYSVVRSGPKAAKHARNKQADPERKVSHFEVEFSPSEDGRILAMIRPLTDETEVFVDGQLSSSVHDLVSDMLLDIVKEKEAK
jgi:hypothetical protein